MLKLSHIKKGYNKKDVLIDVDYTFQEGNIYSLLGGAGAGRTTLFECICGDVPVDEGAIEIPPKAKIFYASKQSILPVYITGYEFISMLCDISDENITVLTMEAKKKLKFKRGIAEEFNGTVESIRRFKGLESDVVIIPDLNNDFMNDEDLRNLLYVGMSRAKAHVVLIIDTEALNRKQRVSYKKEIKEKLL